MSLVETLLVIFLSVDFSLEVVLSTFFVTGFLTGVFAAATTFLAATGAVLAGGVLADGTDAFLATIAFFTAIGVVALGIVVVCVFALDAMIIPCSLFEYEMIASFCLRIKLEFTFDITNHDIIIER